MYSANSRTRSFNVNGLLVVCVKCEDDYHNNKVEVNVVLDFESDKR